MVHAQAITIAATALLAALPVNAGLYSKSSPVVQVDGKNYDRLIAQSNYTSIVEFYAPWCGHCKNLQPAYEKAAKNLAGLAKVAAVNCDEDENKSFCGQFGVQGFPTLKIVKPGKKPGKPIVEDYQGPRTAKGIVDAVVDKIPNLVKRVDDKTLEAWLAEANDTAKAILFTDKGKTSSLLKAIAIDFKGSISVAQIRNTDKETASLELFGITKFPTLLLLPGGKEAEGIVYDGELKKEAMVAFLSQAATPNPDPAPAKVKLPKSKTSKQASKEKETPKSAEETTDEKAEADSTESQQAASSEQPVVTPEPALPIGILATKEQIEAECLGSRTTTCILALIPGTPDEIAAKAVGALSEIAHKHKLHQRKIFPFFVVPENNPRYRDVKEALKLGDDLQIIAINGRRSWWRQLNTSNGPLAEKDVTEESLGNWVESIKLGDGAKQKVPDGLIPEEQVVEEPAEAQEPIKEDPVIEIKVEQAESESANEKHDEL